MSRYIATICKHEQNCKIHKLNNETVICCSIHAFAVSFSVKMVHVISRQIGAKHTSYARGDLNVLTVSDIYHFQFRNFLSLCSNSRSDFYQEDKMFHK